VGVVAARVIGALLDDTSSAVAAETFKDRFHRRANMVFAHPRELGCEVGAVGL